MFFFSKTSKYHPTFSNIFTEICFFSLFVPIQAVNVHHSILCRNLSTNQNIYSHLDTGFGSNNIPQFWTSFVFRSFHIVTSCTFLKTFFPFFASPAEALENTKDNPNNEIRKFFFHIINTNFLFTTFRIYIYI